MNEAPKGRIDPSLVIVFLLLVVCAGWFVGELWHAEIAPWLGRMFG